MGDLSTAVLLEQFDKHMEVLRGRIEKMKGISATLESTPPLPRTKPIGLFDIPLETRLQIYNYCIPRKRIVEVSDPRFHVRWPAKEDDDTQEFEGEDNSWDVEEEDNNQDFESVASDSVIDLWKISNNRGSLLLVSKQIGEEALDLLYGENIFELHLHGEGEYFLRKNFSERNRRRMRYILVIAQPMGVSFKPGQEPDNALWSSTLPNLKVLRLVAQQPLTAAGYYNAPTLEQEMDRWVEWIKPFLECFGQYLRSTIVVEVDDNDTKETSELVKECLWNNYRKVRCHLAGDLIFQRGHFSIESGYWDDDGPTNCRDIVSDWDSD